MGEHRRKVIGGIAAAAAMLALGSAVPNLTWLAPGVLHAVLETLSVAVAAFVGVVALAQYYSRGPALFLYLGVGFLCAAVLEGFHLRIALETHGLPAGADLGPWSWTLSRLALAALLLWGVWVRAPAQISGSPKRAESTLFAVGFLTVLVSMGAVAAAVLPRAMLPEGPLYRPYELLPGAVFLLAVAAHAWRGQWRTDALEYWLLLCLALGAVLHLAVMPGSASLYDERYDAAHLGKLGSYLCMVVGIVGSMSQRFGEAERSAAQLADREARLRALFEQVTAGVILMTPAGVIRSMNPAARQIFRCDAGEAVGRPLSEYLGDAAWLEVGEPLRGLDQRPDPDAFQMRLEVDARRRDGATFPLGMSMTTFQAGDERLVTLLLRDLTEVRQQEWLIQSTLALQNAILAGANRAIISTDRGGRITSFNATAERWFGYASATVVGARTIIDLFDTEEVRARTHRLSVERAIRIESDLDGLVSRARSGLAEEFQISCTRRDGEQFPGLVSVTALRYQRDVVSGYVFIIADVTESREVERLKEEFISTVSHELRTPLTSIRGALGLLAGGKLGALPKDAQPLLQMALNNTERLNRLINDILDIEKMEAGQLAIQFRHVDIDAAVEKSVTAFTGTAYAATLRVEWAERAAGTRVWADEDRLIQVVANLLSNAAKYGDGSITVSVQRLGETVRVSVADTGPGIPERFRDRVFSRFARSDSSDSRKIGGTGLGLYICRQLIERMHGTIGFESRPGRTVFWFDLPCEPALAAPAPSRGRVLHVEDDAAVARLIRAYVGNAAEVVNVRTVGDALRAIQRERFAAVLLDLMLPDGYGPELLDVLKDLQPETPVIIFSAHDVPPSLGAQVQAVLAKAHATEQTIVDTLNKVLNRERRAGS